MISALYIIDLRIVFSNRVIHRFLLILEYEESSIIIIIKSSRRLQYKSDHNINKFKSRI
jgi:hypothetical protein